jgi:phage terminase large subunit-like protein
LRSAWSALQEEGRAREALAELDAASLAALAHDWWVWAREDQLPPDAAQGGGPWRTWLILGGRGSGKTRAGAEWVRAQALAIPPSAQSAANRIALVGETLQQVRSVMIEGVSGLLAVHAAGERPEWRPSKGELHWPNGAIAQAFSAEDYESLRGPQFEVAWCDELAKWRRAERVWDMLQFGLRLGPAPRAVVTTTPRNLKLLKRMLADPTTAVTRAATDANAANLAPAFLDEMRRRYGGTLLGRQELDGEIVDERQGALWRREWIESQRVAGAPDMARIVVAVDPPVTANAQSDACGIVVVGLGEDARAYVLADRTIRGREPATWARAAIAAFRDFEADRIVAEVNQGGDLVPLVMRQVDPNVPVTKVRATRGKWIRAEPVAALYAEGRVAHVGEFADLEAQMCAFGADGLAGGKSPDRLDALVWGLTELMLKGPRKPVIRSL